MSDNVDREDDDDNSDAEGEWVPSCWDSMAQPSRSALKSPDKSSSVSGKNVLIPTILLLLHHHTFLIFIAFFFLPCAHTNTHILFSILKCSHTYI